MASGSARQVKRVIDHSNRTASAAKLALEVSNRIGLEWRLFNELSFWGRLRWLCTGEIRPPQHVLDRLRKDD